MILEEGGNVNQKTVLGSTPLHIAAKAAHRDRDRTVAALLSAGADPKARDVQGYTAVHMLQKEYVGPGVEWIEKPQMHERFRDYMRKSYHH
eukprot:CAMPEP_0206258126 /NCGR_PEP_ID=MMETSP0047_2-20121206/25742_1 /ASSEMBLY_ACC=CAM_ASM_000192 /TAXON_ID=195065 /ORGANISM="Chroomonas mesostigmatica_cf, Strain CCMP1168" /LENGTH=90 /DNA_ID=CAMNT_0053684827 /DNA_START=87 /DNA_END=356 /DNA_ORIENTATION=+